MDTDFCRRKAQKTHRGKGATGAGSLLGWGVGNQLGKIGGGRLDARDGVAGRGLNFRTGILQRGAQSWHGVKSWCGDQRKAFDNSDSCRGGGGGQCVGQCGYRFGRGNMEILGPHQGGGGGRGKGVVVARQALYGFGQDHDGVGSKKWQSHYCIAADFRVGLRQEGVESGKRCGADGGERGDAPIGLRALLDGQRESGELWDRRARFVAKDGERHDGEHTAWYVHFSWWACWRGRIVSGDPIEEGWDGIGANVPDGYFRGVSRRQRGGRVELLCPLGKRATLIGGLNFSGGSKERGEGGSCDEGYAFPALFHNVFMMGDSHG